MDKKEFFAALAAMEEQRGIPKESLAEKIADAIVVAARKDFGGRAVFTLEFERYEEAPAHISKKIIEENAQQ